ncbi:MAG: hypothetical protein ACRDUS_05400 [Mycobacterium sp.]
MTGRRTLVFLAVAGALLHAPVAAADAPQFPDLAQYQADPPDQYLRGGLTQFRTPDGLLCRIDKGIRPLVWCYGPLPAVPQGVNAVANSSFKHWGFLPDNADKNAPVLPPMHSITVLGSQTTSTCVVGEGGLTACRGILTGTSGSSDEDGFTLSPQGSGVWSR